MAIANVLIFMLLISSSSAACFESIICFGDSISDTGNLLLLDAPNKLTHCAHPPYGRSFLDKPTGRCSDGRLIIDFIAESLGLPLVKPYILGRAENLSNREYEKGVNFAVSGARALDVQFFEERGIASSQTNLSLKDEWDWFEQFLTTIPNSRKYLQSTLVLVGEIGGNDYNDPLQQGISIEETKSFVPKVINKIRTTIEELIKLGARTMLIPGNFPVGCLPIYLTKFRTTNVTEYDPKTGCLNWLNNFAEYHNLQLQRELSRIQKLHPHVNIIYADYYNAAMRFYLSPDKYGFTGDVLKACCGDGGPYNFNASMSCGISSVACCDDPSSYASWDGIHFTEASYNLIAQGLFEGPYTLPLLSSICTHNFRRGIDDY